LADLLRRLLHLYDRLKAENKYLRGLLRRLMAEHEAMRRQQTPQAEAAETLLGTAMDEALRYRNREAA
jgi:hypothetical protein